MKPEDALTELDNTIAMFVFMIDAAVTMTDPVDHGPLNEEQNFGMQQLFFHVEKQFKEIRSVLLESAPGRADRRAQSKAEAPDIKQPTPAPEVIAREEERFHGLNVFSGFADKIRQEHAATAADPMQSHGTLPA